MDRPPSWTWIVVTGLVLGLAGCTVDAAEFNRKRAELLCKANDKCRFTSFTVDALPGEEEVFDGTVPPQGQCVGDEEAHLEACTGECTFDAEAAKECIRELRSLKSECTVGSTIEAACAEVYGDCPCSAVPVEVAEPLFTCRVGGDASPWGLALLVAGAIGRRRRRP